MKPLISLPLLFVSSLTLAGPYSHSDYARVSHVEPVYEEIGFDVPRDRCWDETVAYERRSSSAAPLFGALLGGVIGHEVSHGRHHKQLGTFVGASLGAAVASSQARADRHYHTEERCETVYDRQWRREVVGYDVTYRYHGVEYTTRMPYDPGQRIRVDVSVRPAE